MANIMLTTMLLVLGLVEPAPPPIVFEGSLSAYNKWPTVGTLRYRQEHGQLPADLSVYDAFVAVPNCDLIGREGTMSVDDHTFRVMVFDCAGRASHWWMIENGIAAEMDYWFWMTYPQWVGTETPVRIEIHG